MSLFRMPSLGSDMEQATLIEWLIEPGTIVRRGDLIAVVETEKGAIEIEVFINGRLEAYLVQIGDEVLVGAPLAEILTDSDTETEAAPAVPETVSSTSDKLSPPPTLPPTRDTSTATQRISPAARQLASAKTIDLTNIQGSGPGGAIVFADVQNTLDQAPLALEPKRGPVAEFSQMRRAIGAAMARAKREIPHYYLSHTIDIEGAVDWLANENAGRSPAERLLAIALLLKATALAMRKHTDFNGFFEDGDYHASEQVHVGVAIAIRGGGLVAPAVHDTDTLSVNELMTHLKDLTQRVRAGRFRASELRDPTTTVTSLGERGVEAVQGVIYPPQVACIGFGKIVDRPWTLTDRTVASRHTVTISLAADHRVSDGRAGARLLTDIGNLLQSPNEL